MHRVTSRDKPIFPDARCMMLLFGLLVIAVAFLVIAAFITESHF